LASLRLGNTRNIYPYARLVDEHGNPVILERDYRLGFVDTAGGGSLLDWHYVPLDDRNFVQNRREGYDLQLSSGLLFNLSSLMFKLQYQFTRSAAKTDHHRSIESYEARD